jgi:hypothetical protein
MGWVLAHIGAMVVGRAKRERAPGRDQGLELVRGNSTTGKRETDVRFVSRDGRPESCFNIGGGMTDPNGSTAEVPTVPEAMGKVDLVLLATG